MHLSVAKYMYDKKPYSRSDSHLFIVHSSFSPLTDVLKKGKRQYKTHLSQFFHSRIDQV